MKLPLIFSHFNYQPYLAYTLAQARLSNPDRRLILLGDAENRAVAQQFGWEHYHYKDWTDELQKRFDRSYQPLYGRFPRNDDQRPVADHGWYLFWLRYVTERWFFLNAFTGLQNIDRFWHFDSDTMILEDLGEFESELGKADFTTQCGGICLNGLISSKAANHYCEHICTLYEDDRFVQHQQQALDASGTDYGFTEMAACQSFKASSNCRSVWLMDLAGGYVFDDCLAQAHDFETTKIASGQMVKRITFESGRAYGRRNDHNIRMVTLNLSWLPLYVYAWVSKLSKSKGRSDIVELGGAHLSIGVEFARQVEPIRVQANSYAVGQEPALADLRLRFRAERKILVTFASGFQYVQQQRKMGADALRRGEFSEIQNWSFDNIIRTEFFKKNKFILKHWRGQGYWLWKPYILLRSLGSCQDGDLVIYSDCVPNSTDLSENSILPLFSWLSVDERRFAICQNSQPNSSWTKRDCFKLMGCDEPEYWGHSQFAATYFGFIVSSSTRKLIRDWLDFCRDPRILTDADNTCGEENFPDFAEHRHDQSVLSNLLIRDDFTVPVVRFGSEVKSKNIGEMLGFFQSQFFASRVDYSGECVSIGKRWTASSGSVWAPSSGVMEVDVPGRDFFFHTEQEDDPWWCVDLGAIYEISRIIVLNRPNLPHGMRAARMRVFVGIKDETMKLVFDAVASDWDPYTPLIVNMNDVFGQNVKIVLDNYAVLHLKDVQIFGSGPK